MILAPYGFLLENVAFARAVAEAGITLIGPPPEAVQLMGDKITSKELAKKAGVPVIPGHIEAIADEAEAIRVAGEIGYPVLLKPAAGGGGKGMRIVHGPEEMQETLAASHKETETQFPKEEILYTNKQERSDFVVRKMSFLYFCKKVSL